MRELKFRAYIDECGQKSFVFIDLNNTNTDELARFHVVTNKFGVIKEQYTGLKDKNGKEIYEGDIIKSSEYIGEVYRQGNGRWVIFCGKDKLHDGDLIVVGELEGETYDLALTLGGEYCKVIGNIHEDGICE